MEESKDTSLVDYGKMYDSNSNDETPVDETPVDETPVDETPVDETPIDETPIDETPIDETSETYKKKDSPSTHVRVNIASLNVREADSMDADVVMVVNKNERLRVIDDTNPEWAFVEVNNKIGYVKKTFTTPV